MTGLRVISGGAVDVDRDLEAYLAWARDLRGLTPATIRVREWVLNRLHAHVRIPLREVTEDHLLNWESVYVTGLAAQSRRAYVTHVSSFYKWLIQTKVIRQNPADVLTRPKMPKPLPRPIAEDELRMAIFCASPKLAAMITLGAYAGLRAMEISQLNWQDITTTFDGRTVLHVRQGKGGKDRAVPIGKVVLEALHTWGMRSRGPVFLGRDGRQMRPNSVSQVVNEHLHRLGIDATAHKLRHRFATVAAPMLDNDLPLLAQLCGWNSIETAKHYVLADPARLTKLTDALDKLADVEERARSENLPGPSQQDGAGRAVQAS